MVGASAAMFWPTDDEYFSAAVDLMALCLIATCNVYVRGTIKWFGGEEIAYIGPKEGKRDGLDKDLN